MAALAEYASDPKTFLGRHGRGPTTQVLVYRARRYDAIAVERFMRQRLADAGVSDAQHPRVEGQLLRDAGVKVIGLADWDVTDERQWRLDAWGELNRHDAVVPPDWLRSRGLYGGAQGVWVDAVRTRALEQPGVAVSVLHTGRHYADDLDDTRIVYHYPRTGRAGTRDDNEIDAVRNARDLHLPLFVLSEASGGGLRRVRLAWVIGDDHQSQTFLMEFAETEPAQLEDSDPADEVPFATTGARARTAAQIERLERDAQFKFRLLRRYQGRCAVTGIGVQEVLDGAHVVDVQSGGTDDVRNGLLLTADLHRAMDAMLWTLDPDTHTVVTRPQGPTLGDLLVEARGLRPGAQAPHRDALEWRYRRFVNLHGQPAAQLGRRAGTS